MDCGGCGVRGNKPSQTLFKKVTAMHCGAPRHVCAQFDVLHLLLDSDEHKK